MAAIEETNLAGGLAGARGTAPPLFAFVIFDGNGGVLWLNALPCGQRLALFGLTRIGILRLIRLKTTFVVSLTSKLPALWVWLELARADARMSDNFVHLRPGAGATIEVQTVRKMTVAELRKQLVVRSLADLSE